MAAIVWSLNRHLVETLTDISTHDNRSHYLPSWTTHLSVYPGILLLFITVPLQSFRSQAMKTREWIVRVLTLVVAGSGLRSHLSWGQMSWCRWSVNIVAAVENPGLSETYLLINLQTLKCTFFARLDPLLWTLLHNQNVIFLARETTW